MFKMSINEDKQTLIFALAWNFVVDTFKKKPVSYLNSYTSLIITPIT